MILETVKIDRPEHRLGYIIINKSDFDPKSMRLYGEKPMPVREDKPEQVADITEREDRPKRGRPAKAKE